VSGHQAEEACEPTKFSSREVMAASRQASTQQLHAIFYRIDREHAGPSADRKMPGDDLLACLGLDRVDAGHRGAGRG
jgi:hypothetical protein